MPFGASSFHNQFQIDLEEIGFEFNPHDTCVSNGMAEGKQHTVRFHVDDLMSGHMDDSKVNDEFLAWLNWKCGEFGDITAARGNKHSHLQMDIEFKNGEAIVSMLECM